MVSGTSLYLDVSPFDVNHKIYYTTNGTPAADLFLQNPNSEALFLYDGESIFLEESKNPADYALTPNIVNFLSSVESIPGYVSKGVPLSLIEVDENGTIVAERRGTYVFSEDGTEHFGNIPVACLSAPVNEWLTVYNTRNERLMLRAQLEYYDYGTNEQFSLNSQIKRGGNGGGSASYLARTLNANFKKDEHDKPNKTVQANIFQGRKAVGTKRPIQGEVRRFRFHSGGNDVFNSFFIDAFNQRVVSLSETSVATAAYRPCVLYLNGEYWGLYEIREHYDEDYIEYHFSVDSDDVVYVDKTWVPIAGESKYGYNVKTDIETGIALLDELYAFLEYTKNSDGTYTANITKDWTSAEVYADFCNRVDVDSLIDWILIEGYIVNVDFMFNNYKMWRTVPAPSSQKTKNSKFNDGKWRFMLHDTELVFSPVTGQYRSGNIFDLYLGKTGLSPQDHLILSLPAQNEAFKKRLWERAKYMQNTVFAPEKAIAVLEAMQAEIAPLYDERTERWGWGDYTKASWENALAQRKRFLRERPQYFLDNVRSAFGITEE